MVPESWWERTRGRNGLVFMTLVSSDPLSCFRVEFSTLGGCHWASSQTPSLCFPVSPLPLHHPLKGLPQQGEEAHLAWRRQGLAGGS
jgi:hypothetical protein